MYIDALPVIDSVRVLTCLLFLLVASFHDIRSREVPDTLWIIFAPIGLILTLASIALSELSLLRLMAWIIIMAVMSGLALALYYLGLFGGADSKVLMCLAVAMPFQPRLPLTRLPLKHLLNIFIPPPLSTFNNAILLAALSTILILTRNLFDYVRDRRLFEGLEHEGSFKKALALLTGYRVSADRLRSGKHFYLLMEEFVRREDGSIVRRLRMFSRLPANGDLPKEDIPADFHGRVWITPGLPFIVFIALGFLITVFVGDIILLLVNIILVH
ncbi:MAG: A24 family peptidase C-terminal domain-containing protein [Candidatus Bathyarchaeia archaeon]